MKYQLRRHITLAPPRWPTRHAAFRGMMIRLLDFSSADFSAHTLMMRAIGRARPAPPRCRAAAIAFSAVARISRASLPSHFDCQHVAYKSADYISCTPPMLRADAVRPGHYHSARRWSAAIQRRFSFKCHAATDNQREYRASRRPNSADR